MKLHHPTGIAFIALVVLLSVTATLVVQARTRNAAQSGSTPNPAIEWVLIQLSPKTPGNAGISITIQGYNFTDTNNSVGTRNTILKGGLTAVNGVAVIDPDSPTPKRFEGMQPKIIKFELPEGVPCAIGEACPLHVENVNGVSNTVFFKLY